MQEPPGKKFKDSHLHIKDCWKYYKLIGKLQEKLKNIWKKLKKFTSIRLS